jgi:hypothetical protein
MLAVDAINGLIDKIQEQAQHEGVVLSPIELKMLRWSEVEAGAVHSEVLNNQFESKFDSEEYENKISGLLARAYQRETKDSKLELRWHDIREALNDHDYYLIVMLQRAFATAGSRDQSTLRDNLIYFAVGIGIALTVGYFIVTTVK